MRKDKVKNTIAVAKAIINSDTPPTQREISEMTWLWKGTVGRAIDHLGESGALNEPEVIDFIKLDLEVQALAMKEKIRRLKDEAKDQPYQALDSFDNTSFKRSQLLQWKATERKEVRLDLSKATEAEIDEGLKSLLD